MRRCVCACTRAYARPLLSSSCSPAAIPHSSTSRCAAMAAMASWVTVRFCRHSGGGALTRKQQACPQAWLGEGGGRASTRVGCCVGGAAGGLKAEGCKAAAVRERPLIRTARRDGSCSPFRACCPWHPHRAT